MFLDAVGGRYITSLIPYRSLRVVSAARTASIGSLSALAKMRGFHESWAKFSRNEYGHGRAHDGVKQVPGKGRQFIQATYTYI
jgi:hypothetical protein